MENHMLIVKPESIPTAYNYMAYHRDLNLDMESDWNAMYNMLDYLQAWYEEHGGYDGKDIIDSINFLMRELPGTIQDWQAKAKGE